MKFRFILKHRDEHSVSSLCRTVKVSRSGFSSWYNRGISKRKQSDLSLVTSIAEIHSANRRVYGSPRIHKHLQLHNGIHCSRKRVERLMRENGIIARHKRKYKPRATNSNHDFPIAPNVLNREINRSCANEAWVADISYIRTSEGFLYLATVMDLYSRPYCWLVHRSSC